MNAQSPEGLLQRVVKLPKQILKPGRGGEGIRIDNNSLFVGGQSASNWFLKFVQVRMESMLKEDEMRDIYFHLQVSISRRKNVMSYYDVIPFISGGQIPLHAHEHRGGEV